MVDILAGIPIADRVNQRQSNRAPEFARILRQPEFLKISYGQKTRNWSIHKDLRDRRKVARVLEHWFTFAR